MKYEKTEWGGRFTDKPYYPMLLANGVDAVLIDIMGSGDCSGDGWDLDLGKGLPLERPVGWYKSDRRVFEDTQLVYGLMFPLFDFSSAPILNGDKAVPRNTRQYFKPDTAVLTSFYDQVDIETGEWLEVKVTTFMTRNHVLVEHYDILRAPRSGVALQFYLNSPSRPYLDLYKPVTKLKSARVRVDRRKSMVCYDYACGRFTGGARSWFDIPCASATVCDTKIDKWVKSEMTTRPLRAGESVTRYVAAIDSMDAPDFNAALDCRVSESRKLGFQRILEQHLQDWQNYFATSSVCLPDPGMQHIYEMGRYLIRATQYPEKGFLPIGVLPSLWQGAMFWDAAFAVEALLSCGNPCEAQAVLAHIQRLMPLARRWARKFHARGARLEWTITTTDFSDYGHPCLQFHNNAVWAHMAFLCYRYSGDLEVLRRLFDVLEEFVIFLADHCLQDRGDHLIVAQCEGIDESVSHPKTNDTWTCASTLRALLDYREALGALQRASKIPALDEVIRKLTAGLAKNVDAAGVMQSFQGGCAPHWGSLIFHLFPDHPALGPTLHRMMQNYDADMGFYNFHAVTRYSEKAFPWASFWAARILALAGDDCAQKVLQADVESIDYFGGLPERILYHGERFNNRFITAPAAMVHAVNTMLASANGLTLRILGGARKTWRNVHFTCIAAGEGLVVSADIRKGQLRQLMIENLYATPRTVRLLLGRQVIENSLRLLPGDNQFHLAR